MSLTTDPNDPKLKEGQKETGQNATYLVLPEEERAKGFIRPVRNSYVHVGKKNNYIGVHRILDESEQMYESKKYVAIMTVMTNEDGSFKGGTYVTQEEFESWQKNERYGGCGTLTTMGQALSETYARDPKFYGQTFCCGCNMHLPVKEFVWDGTDITVGS